MRRLMFVLLFACHVDPAAKDTIAAAKQLTRDYGKSELQAFAAGQDCKVLVIESETKLDTTAIESIHYGSGEYGVNGGAEQFSSDHRFRAVAYRDSSGIVQTYGSITRDEARSMPRCR